MDPLFADTLYREVGLLQVRFPELADALSRAYAIVAAGNVFPEESGREAMVLASDGVSFYHVNGSCTCKASTYRADVCKHRLALRLYQRVADAMLAEEERWEPDDANPAFQPPAAAPTIPAEHLVQIQGKPFVKFAGLLQLAHQRGLQALRADWTYNDATLSLAHAVAVFPFGTLERAGMPRRPIAAKTVAVHFRRVALTRAKARVLRDALGLDAVAVEELGEEPPPS